MQALEEHELEFPSKVIYEDDYPLYPTCGATPNLLELEAVPVLTDFGTARSSKATHQGWGMAHSYRAPEILLGLSWSAEIDIWSIGVMVRDTGQSSTSMRTRLIRVQTLELLEGRSIFQPFDPATGEYSFAHALAQYISILGLPPLPLLQRSRDPNLKHYFNDKG